jgi:hypothetical protein
MIGVALWTQRKGFAEERSDRVDVLKIISNVAFKAGPREVGESRCLVRMAGWTLVQDQLKMIYGIVQVRDRHACHVCGKSFMARICVLNNLTFDDRLQEVFCQQKPAIQRLMSLTSSTALS